LSRRIIKALHEHDRGYGCAWRIPINIGSIQMSFRLARPLATISFILHLHPRPVIRRIELKVPGHSFRYAVEGAGLIQLYLDGPKDGIIYDSHYGHWSEAGARQRSILPADECDWPALAKLSGRIQRHIRRHLATAKLWGRPILHQAFTVVQQGHGLFYSGTVHRADSKDIQNVPA